MSQGESCEQKAFRMVPGLQKRCSHEAKFAENDKMRDEGFEAWWVGGQAAGTYGEISSATRARVRAVSGVESISPGYKVRVGFALQRAARSPRTTTQAAQAGEGYHSSRPTPLECVRRDCRTLANTWDGWWALEP